MKTIFFTLSILMAVTCFSQEKELLISYNYKNDQKTQKLSMDLRANGHASLTTVVSTVFCLKAGQSEAEAEQHDSYYHIFKDYKTKSMFWQSITSKELLVKDPMNLFDWKIDQETIMILGYQCHKAHSKYRGRNYEAWFTTQLPFKAAPWKINGLPGVVLKARSTDNFIDIEAKTLKIQNANDSIENPYKNKKYLTWKEYVPAYKKKIERILAFMNATLAKGGSMDQVKNAPAHVEIIFEGNRLTSKERTKRFYEGRSSE